MPRGPIAEYLDWAAWSPDGRRIYFAGSRRVRRSAHLRPGRRRRRAAASHSRRICRIAAVTGRPDAGDGRSVWGVPTCVRVDGGADPQPLPGYMDGDALLQWSRRRQVLVHARGRQSRPAESIAWIFPAGAREFWRELVPPDPTVLTDIGSDPGQVRMTPDGQIVRIYILDVRGRALPRSRFELGGGAQLLSQPVKSPSSCRRSTSAPAAASSSPRPWWWPSQTGQSSRRARRSLRRRA